MINSKTKLSFLLLVTFVLPTTVISNYEEPSGNLPAYIEGEVLVTFKENTIAAHQVNVNKISERSDIKAIKQLKHSPVTIFKSENKSTNEIIESLKNDPLVEVVQPNYIYRTMVQEVPWGIGNNNNSGVNADLVQNHYNITGNNTIAAILDTGINYNHVDLAANIWNNSGEANCTDGIDNDINGYIDDCLGYDFIGTDYSNRAPDNDPDDPIHGHGTHVSGTVAAVNNTQGVVGVAPNAKLMAVKVLDDVGIGTTVTIVDGITYARINGADVINLSLGGEVDDPLQRAAVDDAFNAGITIVSSTGNGGVDWLRDPEVGYPARYANVIGVGAVDINNNYADFSNYGPDLNIMAPGVNITSTVFSDYQTWQGTSMATPHVVGIVALMKERDSSLSPSQIMTAIYDTAFDLGAAGRDDDFGYGLANVKMLFDQYFNVADVDADKSVTTTDATLALQNSLGIDMASTNWENLSITGDVNCDGVANSTDAMLILRKSAGLDPVVSDWCE